VGDAVPIPGFIGSLQPGVAALRGIEGLPGLLSGGSQMALNQLASALPPAFMTSELIGKAGLAFQQLGSVFGEVGALCTLKVRLTIHFLQPPAASLSILTFPDSAPHNIPAGPCQVAWYAMTGPVPIMTGPVPVRCALTGPAPMVTGLMMTDPAPVRCTMTGLLQGGIWVV
jgi:hypothetical protein